MKIRVIKILRNIFFLLIFFWKIVYFKGYYGMIEVFSNWYFRISYVLFFRIGRSKGFIVGESFFRE